MFVRALSVYIAVQACYVGTSISDSIAVQACYVCKRLICIYRCSGLLCWYSPYLIVLLFRPVIFIRTLSVYSAVQA
jgi:hypothetical protein